MAKGILNKEEIRQKYQDLVNGKFTLQQRGFEFEKLIFSLLYNENLEPKASYKPKGEQIDGSFFWQGQTFLLEAKWVSDPLPVSSIYSFKGKLDGKFHTTSGVFISVNGYSNDVEDALKFGKSLNILLFDENDTPLIFNGDVTFLEVLKFKLREAGDTGSLKVPYKLKERAEEISKANPEILMMDQLYAEQREIAPKKGILIDDLLVFVEGQTDIPIIKNLIDQIKKYYSLSYKIEVLNGANNIRQLPSLLNIYGDYRKTKAVIVVLDNDQESRQMEGVIKNVVEQFQKSSISIRPIFLYINESLKEKLSENMLTIDELRNELIFERLETFIQQIAEDYYDPETSIPLEALQNSLANLEWDFERGIIEGTEEYNNGHPFEINSLEELVEHLNEEMVQAMQGEMPTEWLKEQEYLDYNIEVREYLFDNYLDDIKKMGWNENDL